MCALWVKNSVYGLKLLVFTVLIRFRECMYFVICVLAVITPSGGFGVTDMAALGATLGVLLFLCLVIIGVLIYRMRKGKADWGKIKEASMFRSSVSSKIKV